MNEILVSIEPVVPQLRLELVDPEDIHVSLVPFISGGSQATFTWTQDTPLATWTIPHNLGRKPSVTVVDSTDTEVQTGVRYVDENIIQILNASAFAGKAYLN